MPLGDPRNAGIHKEMKTMNAPDISLFQPAAGQDSRFIFQRVNFAVIVVTIKSKYA